MKCQVLFLQKIIKKKKKKKKKKMLSASILLTSLRNTFSQKKNDLSHSYICVKNHLIMLQIIGGLPSQNVSLNMRKMHRFRLILRRDKVSSGHLLSIYTFYSVQ